MSIAPYRFEKYKYNGNSWGYYTVYPLVQNATRTVLWQPRGTAIHHYKRDWQMGRDHLQFLSPNGWYAISADYWEDRQLRHCYCDIIAPWQPPTNGTSIISIVDLELDLAVEPTKRYEILDEDEFALAVTAMRYPAELATQAQQALDALIVHAKAWSGPFAQIPMTLTRTDLHTLDADSADLQAALLAMRLH